MARHPARMSIMGWILARLPRHASRGSTRFAETIRALWHKALPRVACAVGLTLAACAVLRHDAREKRFAEQFPYEDLNRALALESIEGVTETTLGRVITLQLVNKSDHIIAFSPRDDIVGLVYDAERNEWVEVENAVMHSEMVEGLWPGGSGIPNATAVYFQPVLEEPFDSISIRVMVVGRVWEKESGFGQSVAAYIDVTLTP